jgi:hypothetical protein
VQIAIWQNEKMEFALIKLNSNSINNFLSWFNSNFSCCSGSHNNFKDNNYINLTEGISPPTHKWAGIRNARFT